MHHLMPRIQQICIRTYASKYNTICIAPAARSSVFALFVLFCTFIIVYYFRFFRLHASFGASWKINWWRYVSEYLGIRQLKYLDSLVGKTLPVCLDNAAIKCHYEISLLAAQRPFALAWVSPFLFNFFLSCVCLLRFPLFAAKNWIQIRGAHTQRSPRTRALCLACTQAKPFNCESSAERRVSPQRTDDSLSREMQIRSNFRWDKALPFGKK